jgi:hypothetical protein
LHLGLLFEFPRSCLNLPLQYFLGKNEKGEKAKKEIFTHKSMEADARLQVIFLCMYNDLTGTNNIMQKKMNAPGGQHYGEELLK